MLALIAAGGGGAPHIPVVHAIVLGAVQGLTEFLPISSSGHLLLVPWLFEWTELDRFPELEKAFDVALHLGTFAAVVAYFWRDLAALVPAGVRAAVRRRARTAEERLALLLVFSAVPGALVGALLESFINDHLGAPWLIAVMLVVFAGVLFVADRAPTNKAYEDFRVRDALVMGAAQAAALSPGVSRSGVTISAGRFLGFDRDAAARLSFLMSLPIIAGALGFSGGKLIADGGPPPGTGGAFVWGTLTSAATGLLAITVLLRLLRSRSFTLFVVYRVIAGVGVLALILTGVRPAT